MKQTAIEWFFKWFNDNPEATHKEYAEAFEQAKEMEKEQIISAVDSVERTSIWQGGFNSADLSNHNKLN